MRLVLALGLVALAGCATPISSQEYVAQQGNFDVCRLTMRGPHARNAELEAQRRGLDCRPLYPAIEAQLQRDTQILQHMLTRPPQTYQHTPAPAYQMPRQTNCTSYRVGNTIQTDCR